MTQIKKLAPNNITLEKYLKGLLLELKKKQVITRGSCGSIVEIVERKKNIIDVVELIHYFPFKYEEMLREPIDFEIQSWVRTMDDNGTGFITFDRETAEENSDTVYYYDLFPE